MWYKFASGLFIDDLRNPDYAGMNADFIARNSQDAINYVKNHGCPSFISFDHDLGGNDTAMIFVKWLVDYDMDNDGKIIPDNFTFQVHSANPVGSLNIKSYLENYLRVRNG